MQIDDHFQATGGRFSNIGFTGWSTPPTTTPLTIGMWGLGTTTGVFGLIDDRSMLPTTAIPTADSYAGTAGVLGAGNTGTGVAGIGNRVGVFGQSGRAPALSAGRTCGVLGASRLAPGVVGESLTGTGVLGTSGPNPPSRPFTEAGVIGASDENVGVLGMSNYTGVFGFSGAVNGKGISGVADGVRGIAVRGVATGTAGFGVMGEGGEGGRAGMFVGDVEITQALIVNGSVNATVKNALVPFPDGSTRVLHCMESPEHWFEDFGTARLKSGRAVVKLDADFAKTIKVDDYHVFLTPEGDCGGLYIRNKGNASFEVREVKGGTSDVAFSYRIVGRRKDIRKHRRFAKFIRERLALAPETRTRSPVDALLAKVRKQVAAKPARAGRRNTARFTQRLSTLLARVRKQARTESARKRKRGKRA